MNAIGDAYLTMSGIEAIRKKYSNAEFYFVFPEHARVLCVEGSENLNFIFSEKKYSSFFKVYIKLFPIKFDRIFSFFPGTFNSALLFFLRGKIKAGQINYRKIERWDNQNAKLQIKRGFVRREKVIQNKDENFLSRISTILKSTDDINAGIEKYKPILSNDYGNKINNVLIHYKASIKEKSLSLDLLIELIKLIKDNTDFDICIVGSKSDFTDEEVKELSNYSIKYLIEPDLQNLVKAIRTSYFIGVDSFPLHLADAYNTNFLALCSMTDPNSVLVNYNKSLAFDADSFEEVKPEDFITRVHHYFVKNDFIISRALTN